MKAKGDSFMTRFAMEKAILENNCPGCGAKPGEPCASKGVRLREGVCHLGRMHDSREEASGAGRSRYAAPIERRPLLEEDGHEEQELFGDERW